MKKIDNLEEGHKKFDSVRDYDDKELAMYGRRDYMVVRCLYKV